MYRSFCRASLLGFVVCSLLNTAHSACEQTDDVEQSGWEGYARMPLSSLVRAGRSETLGLVPFPRVGKRMGSLVPFPRVGRAGSLIAFPRVGRLSDLEKRQNMFPHPRVGKRAIRVPKPQWNDRADGKEAIMAPNWWPQTTKNKGRDRL